MANEGLTLVRDRWYTALTADVTSAATSLPVVTNTVGGNVLPTPCIIMCGFEQMYATASTATTITVTRGFNSTAAAHAKGATVGIARVAAHHNDLMTTIASLSASGGSLTLNGNYDHFQRGVGARTCTTTFDVNTSFSADRFFTRPAGASVTTQRSTTVPDTRSQASLQITGAASVTTVDHGQRIPATVVNTRGRQPLVFSAYVRNESGAAFTPTLRIDTPSVADTYASKTNRLAQTLQSCADSAWTQVSHVFDPTAYTNITNGMEAVLQIPSGSCVSGDTITIAQFDIRPGSAVPAFPPPDPDAELWRCLSYCYVPSSEFVGLAATVQYLESGAYYYPRPMRAVPTITSGIFGVNAGSAGTFRAQQIGLRSCFLDNSAANWTVNALVTIAATFTAEIS